jgi:hypothetical protein
MKYQLLETASAPRRSLIAFPGNKEKKEEKKRQYGRNGRCYVSAAHSTASVRISSVKQPSFIEV